MATPTRGIWPDGIVVSVCRVPYTLRQPKTGADHPAGGAPRRLILSYPTDRPARASVRFRESSITSGNRQN